MTPSRRAAETVWSGGDGLTWCNEHWYFLHFSPAYPRAMCQAQTDGRVVAIDITTAKRVDPATERKRAERLRRREAGEVRCELWIAPNEVEAIKQKHGNAMWTPSDCVRFAVAWCASMK